MSMDGLRGCLSVFILFVFLHLKESSSQTLFQQIRYGETGSFITMFCDEDYNSTGFIMWEGPPAMVLNTSDGQVNIDPMAKALQEGRLELSNHNRELTIKNLSTIDAGVYRCLGMSFRPAMFQLKVDLDNTGMSDESAFKSDKPCYLPGERVKLTGVYRGPENVTLIEWFYSEEVKSNLVLDVVKCAFATTDEGFPDSLSVECENQDPAPAQTFILTVNNIKDKDLNTIWGQRMVVGARIVKGYHFLEIKKCTDSLTPEMIVG